MNANIRVRGFLALALFVGTVHPTFADDAVEQDLEVRNAERAKSFDAEAQAYKVSMQRALRNANASEQSNALSDSRDAQAHSSAVAAARLRARRKTGLVLGVLALAAAGIGTFTYSSARNDEAAIQNGTLATGSDITSTADMINVKQGVAFGGWGVGILLACVGLGVAW